MNAFDDGRSSSFRGGGDPQPERWLSDPRYVLFPKKDGNFPGVPYRDSSWNTGVLKLPLNRYLCSETPADLYRAAAQIAYPKGKPSSEKLATLRQELADNYEILELNFKRPLEIADLRYRAVLADGDKLLDEVFRLGKNETEEWKIVRRAFYNRKRPIALVVTYSWPPTAAFCMVVNVDRVRKLIEEKKITVSVTSEYDVPEDLFKKGPSLLARGKAISTRTWMITGAAIGFAVSVTSLITFFSPS